jgi:hypothetical protein
LVGFYIKAEKLTVVISIADGFKATVGALRSLYSEMGVSFHTSLPEDRCVRLLVKNLGKQMLESVVREELEALDICVQEVTRLRSGGRDQDPAKDRPPNAHFIISVVRGPEVCRVRSLTELCPLRVTLETYVAPKDPCNASSASASVIRSVTANTCSGASRVGDLTSLVSAQSLRGSPSAAAVGATTRLTTGAA